MPGGDVLVRIVQPQREVQAPDAVGAIDEQWDVIPLVSDLSSWAALRSFVSKRKADYARESDNPGHQLYGILWAEVSSDKRHQINLAPAHQLGDVAAGYGQRAEIGEDP
jgi:hypothetical protein